DLVMVGRAASAPLPDCLSRQLAPPLKAVSALSADFFRQSGAALRSHAHALQLEQVEQALRDYKFEVAALRREGLTRSLSDKEAERFFTLGFALEQMFRNLLNLKRIVDEWRPEKNPEERALDSS